MRRRAMIFREGTLRVNGIPLGQARRLDADRSLGVFICLGHIVGATLLVAEHLF